LKSWNSRKICWFYYFHLQIVEKRSELSAEEKERRKRVQREKLSLEPVRKSLRMQNIDAETGLQSKKEPSFYFSSRKTTMDPKWQTDISNINNGDHHFVFGNDSPRLPLEVPYSRHYNPLLIWNRSWL
jgi:hypothetical protein